MSIYHSRFIVHFYTVVAPRVASCIAVQAKHPVRVCFTWGHSHARVYTRVEESSPLEPRHGTLLSVLSSLDDRGRYAWAFGSRRQSGHVTISVLGTGATVDGSSILSVGRVAHPRPLSRHFNLPRCKRKQPSFPPSSSWDRFDRSNVPVSILSIPFRLQLVVRHVHHARTDALREIAPWYFFFFFQLDWTNFKSVCTWRHEWKINITTNR